MKQTQEIRLLSVMQRVLLVLERHIERKVFPVENTEIRACRSRIKELKEEIMRKGRLP